MFLTASEASSTLFFVQMELQLRTHWLVWKVLSQKCPNSGIIIVTEKEPVLKEDHINIMEANSKEDRIFLSRIEELAEACRNQYRVTQTEFLDLRQQSLARQQMKYVDSGIRWGIYGGYEEAERVIMVYLPDYITETGPVEYFEAEPEENPLTVLRLIKKKGTPPLSHRDYLGALMGLGIRREVTGDILVREDGADVIVLRSMAEYIATHLSQAGHSELTVEETGIDRLIVPQSDAKEKHVSVASLRLDSVLGAAFGLSRSKAMEAVRSGIVFVNGQEIVKPDRAVEEGDKIVLRHRGRVRVQEVGGKTGKGRTHVTLLTYR